MPKLLCHMGRCTPLLVTHPPQLKKDTGKEKGQTIFLLNTSACMSQLPRLLLLALLAPARGMLVLEKVKVLMDDIKVCASRWCRAQRGHPARAPSTAAANKASPEGAAARAASPSLDLPSAPPRRPATLASGQPAPNTPRSEGRRAGAPFAPHPGAHQREVRRLSAGVARVDLEDPSCLELHDGRGGDTLLSPPLPLVLSCAPLSLAATAPGARHTPRAALAPRPPPLPPGGERRGRARGRAHPFSSERAAPP